MGLALLLLSKKSQLVHQLLGAAASGVEPFTELAVLLFESR